LWLPKERATPDFLLALDSILCDLENVMGVNKFARFLKEQASLCS